jgi:hypothetical protein
MAFSRSLSDSAGARDAGASSNAIIRIAASAAQSGLD